MGKLTGAVGITNALATLGCCAVALKKGENRKISQKVEEYYNIYNNIRNILREKMIVF